MQAEFTALPALCFENVPNLKNNILEKKEMKYVCPCGYEYDPALGDPDHGIAPGTPWEDIPEDFECPVCGLGKDSFEVEE